MECSVINCGRELDPETESIWEFDPYVLCQDHWEEYSSWAFWQTQGGLVDSGIEDDLDAWMKKKAKEAEAG